MRVESKPSGPARLHAALTSWLWGRAALLAVALPVAWITGSFFTGLIAAFILLAGVFVSTNLLAGALVWRRGRSFAARDGRVLVARRVLEHDAPILVVSHSAEVEGEWRFLNAQADATDPAALTVSHVNAVIELDPSVAALSDLGPGWRASRTSEDAQWVAEQALR